MTSIYYDGNVGISNSTPAAKLHLGNNFTVDSSANFAGLLGFNRDVNTGTILNPAYEAFQMHNQLGVFSLQCYNTDKTPVAGGNMAMQPNGNVHFGLGTTLSPKPTGLSAEGRLVINATTEPSMPHISLLGNSKGGDLHPNTMWGVGFQPYTNNFAINCWGMADKTFKGVNLVPGALAWGQYSDERLKDIKSDLTGVLDRLDAVRCIKYKFKEGDEDMAERYGFSAQNIDSQFDGIVDKAGDHMTMSYTDMIPIGIAGIKELRAELAELRRHVLG
jgi:hypothetical protein